MEKNIQQLANDVKLEFGSGKFTFKYQVTK